LKSFEKGTGTYRQIDNITQLSLKGK
jgi:hypothetical protein